MTAAHALGPCRTMQGPIGPACARVQVPGWPAV